MVYGLRVGFMSRWRVIALVWIVAATVACGGEGGGQGAASEGVNNEGGPGGGDAFSDASSDVAQGEDGGDEVEPDVVEPPEPADPDCMPLDCEAFLGCEGPDCPILSDYAPVVPSPGLPMDVEVQNANNNLDVVRHDGRVFLAFRTAPYHFADAGTELIVVSSEDQRQWRFEGRFTRGKDLREMRLLSFEGRLLMYFAVLGTNPIDFEPEGMMVTEYMGPGTWTEPEWFYGEGFIPWRVRAIDGVPYMTAYVGGENIYDIDGDPLEVHWLTSEDGLSWGPVLPQQPVVLEGGSSETDFVLMDDGAVVAVSRNEAGDELGWGSKVCRAEADALGDWECVGDPRKYDSPLLFRHGDGVWLIGRRNVSETGHYDLGEGETPAQRTSRNLLNYSNRPKRCSLWRVDPEALTVSFVLDLPSKGDTCFASVVPEGDNAYTVYNYTSPLDGRDVPWLVGQSGHTLIYRVRLTFP